MIAAIAEGPSVLYNYATGADCRSTLNCLESLGVQIHRTADRVEIAGGGLHGFQAPGGPLDAGNSGSTIRMLAGLLAGQPFPATLIGDESLSRRPMQRILKPLARMGAVVSARDGKFPPLTVQGRDPLRAIDYAPEVASAQVKTCVLFAGLYGDGPTTVRESVRTRDHTEMALREFGADLTISAAGVTIEPHPRLRGREIRIPGDLSSAAFFLVAALLLPGSALMIEDVGLNPTRTALLDYLASIGAPVTVRKCEQVSGELVGDLEVRYAPTGPGVIAGPQAAALIDEIPVLAVLGALGGGLTVRDAAELRVKETDRIATLAENFRRAGVDIDVQPDGFRVPGGQKIQPASFDSFGDHRIAMAFTVASLTAPEKCTIEGAQAASVSFPEFYHHLERLAV